MLNLLPLILVGFFVYLIFSGRISGGCCGHGRRNARRRRDFSADDPKADNFKEEVIDLRKDEYTVISTRYDRGRIEDEKSKAS